jgi:hypothetical protein
MNSRQAIDSLYLKAHPSIGTVKRVNSRQAIN